MCNLSEGIEEKGMKKGEEMVGHMSCDVLIYTCIQSGNKGNYSEEYNYR